MLHLLSFLSALSFKKSQNSPTGVATAQNPDDPGIIKQFVLEESLKII